MRRRVQLLENVLQQIMGLYEDALGSHDPVRIRGVAGEMVRLARLAVKGDDTEEVRSIVLLRSRLVRVESALEVATGLLRDATKDSFMDTVRSLLGDAEAAARLSYAPVLGDLVDRVRAAEGEREGLGVDVVRVDHLVVIVGLQRLLIEGLEGENEELGLALNRLGGLS